MIKRCENEEEVSNLRKKLYNYRSLVGTNSKYIDFNVFCIEFEKRAKEKIEMCLKHMEYLSKIKPEKLVCLEMRSHVVWYLKGIPGGKNIKEKIYATNNLCDIITILTEFKEEF